ncbi:hypothetical protein BDZ90DRAFT_257268 [Jaminaea rosea]|uniref:Dolichyl-diphosphooligosaccharide--protein glycosyltransferase subunit 2 n=1 Tax=Jaminaea rosea TaxID=1569628 RepID=A0A316V3Z9_9BASI|nr:hypothetical protein BDZ90DRAFT_257268 [Jaminaea rosea]PWN30175.1 hypothetical protein BDZ90DRAFT_257268 [Jaminaea rosea]
MRLFAASAVALTAIATLASTTAAAAAPFTAGKFALSTVDGSSRLSEPFTPQAGIASLPTKVDSDEIIRLSFTVPTGGSSDDGDESSSSSSSSSIPSQIVLQLLSKSDSSKAASFVPNINKGNGKVTWSQRVDRLPVEALATLDAAYTLRLLIAGASTKPLSLELGDLTIPTLTLDASSAGVSSTREYKAREMGFYPWPERRHTFRKEVTEGMPGKTKSLVVLAVIVTVPWLVLLGLLTPLLGSVKLNTSPKPSVCLLLASLLFLETIGFRYYRGDFTLFRMLPFFLAGSAVAAGSVVAGALEGVGAASGSRKSVKSS